MLIYYWTAGRINYYFNSIFEVQIIAKKKFRLPSLAHKSFVFLPTVCTINTSVREEQQQSLRMRGDTTTYTACVCVCVCRRGWEGAGTRVWAPPPQSHGAPMFQWKQVGTPALLQSHRQSARAESAGQEAGPNQLDTRHRKKSGKNTSEPACRSPSSFCACFGSGCGEYQRGSTSPERRWSSHRHLAAADGCSVGTLRRDGKRALTGFGIVFPHLFLSLD